MNARALNAVCVAALAACAAGLSLHAESAPPGDGLAPVSSRYLDDLRLRPGADFGAYRRILIDPVPVEFHRNWVRNMITEGRATHKLNAEDASVIARDFAASLERNLVGAFKAKGYELEATPGPGVLRLSPAISELYVNAPDRLLIGRSAMFVREAGDAVLTLDARDSATGELLARVVHRGTASSMNRFMRSSDVFTRYWFDALFSHWATDCAGELARAGKQTRLSRLDEPRSAGGALQ